MATLSITDLTVDELKDVIREVVTQTIFDIFSDPDEGLQLREDIAASLRHSLATVEAGGKTIPAEDVAAKLGLEW